MKILVVIDSFAREAAAVYSLVGSLRDAFGYRNVRICSRYSLALSFNRIRPDVVILPKTHKIPDLKSIHEQCTVLLMQAESFTGSREALETFSAGAGWQTEFVDYALCWGKFDHDFYLEKGIFPEGKSIITGHPTTDFWYRKKKRLVKASCDTATIGFSTSLRGLTHISGMGNPIEFIYKVEQSPGSGYYDPPNHAESFLLFEAAWIRLLINLMEELRGYNVSIRPHPIENPEHYSFFKRWGYVTISRHRHIIDWLDEIDVLASYISTSQLDAYVRGVNVISLRNLFPPAAKEAICKSIISPMNNFFEGPATVEEFKRSISSKPRRLPAADEFASNVFNFDGRTRPSQKIADFLRDLSTRGKLRKKPFESISTKGFGLVGWIPSVFFPDFWFLLLKDWQRILFRKGQLSIALSFCPHRIFRNRRFKNLVQESFG